MIEMPNLSKLTVSFPVYFSNLKEAYLNITHTKIMWCSFRLGSHISAISSQLLSSYFMQSSSVFNISTKWIIYLSFAKLSSSSSTPRILLESLFPSIIMAGHGPMLAFCPIYSIKLLLIISLIILH